MNNLNNDTLRDSLEADSLFSGNYRYLTTNPVGTSAGMGIYIDNDATAGVGEAGFSLISTISIDPEA